MAGSVSAQIVELITRMESSPAGTVEELALAGGGRVVARRSPRPGVEVEAETERVQPERRHTVFAATSERHANYPDDLPLLPGARLTVIRAGEGSEERLFALWAQQGDLAASLDQLLSESVAQGWEVAKKHDMMPPLPSGVSLTRGNMRRTIGFAEKPPLLTLNQMRVREPGRDQGS
jgi:hypothetical protein